MPKAASGGTELLVDPPAPRLTARALPMYRRDSARRLRALLSAIYEPAAADAGQPCVDPSLGPAGIAAGSGFRATRVSRAIGAESRGRWRAGLSGRKWASALHLRSDSAEFDAVMVAMSAEQQRQEPPRGTSQDHSTRLPARGTDAAGADAGSSAKSMT